MSTFNPAVVLFDLNGQRVGTPTNVLHVSGSTTVSGPVQVTTTGSLLITGSVGLAGVKAALAVRTSVAASTTSVVLLAANPNRKGVIIYNDSTSVLYIGYGSTAVSDSDFTVQTAAETHHNVFSGFVGEIRAMWVTAEGAARITEMT